tara:strand:+ start:161 stop:496 length:336 start_codon:yes stop_codon:yes gene_type:complete
MEKQTYINGLGQKYTFELIDDNKIIWKGDFNNCKCSMNQNQNYLFINPIGGPHIKIGTLMMYMSSEFVGLEVCGIELNNKSEVIIKCNKHNNDDLGEYFHLQDRDIIGGII